MSTKLAGVKVVGGSENVDFATQVGACCVCGDIMEEMVAACLALESLKIAEDVRMSLCAWSATHLTSWRRENALIVPFGQ